MNTHRVNISFADELSDLLDAIASFNEAACAARNSFASRVSSPGKFRGTPDAAYARARVKSLKQRKASDSCPQSITRLCSHRAEGQCETNVSESSAESPPTTASLQTQMSVAIVVARKNQLYEVTVLTPEILREACWRQLGDVHLRWSSLRALTGVFRPVSSKQEFEDAERYLAALPTREIVTCQNAFLDDLLKVPIEHGRTKEVNKLRQAMRAAPVWTELRVRLRPISHSPLQGATARPYPKRFRLGEAAQTRVSSNEIQVVKDETLRVLCRPPHSPRSNSKTIKQLGGTRDKSSNQL